MSINFVEVPAPKEDKDLQEVEFRFMIESGEPGIQVFDPNTEEWHWLLYIDTEGKIQLTDDCFPPGIQVDDDGFPLVEK